MRQKSLLLRVMAKQAQAISRVWEADPTVSVLNAGYPFDVCWEEVCHQLQTWADVVEEHERQ